MKSATDLRSRVFKFLNSTPFLTITFIVTVALMGWIGGMGYLIGLAIALLTFWASGWDWSYFGISLPKWGETIFKAVIYTVSSILILDVVIIPLVEYYLRTPHDLSGFEFLQGNFRNLVLFMLFMWIIAGFGEEFFYRGYMMKRIAVLLGDTENNWIAAVVLSAIPFGLVHFYQGISGVITAGVMGLILGYIFLRNKNNLVVCMLTHGFYDMFGLTMIYLGKEAVITDWAQQFLFSTIY